jgi:hypothetical protein
VVVEEEVAVVVVVVVVVVVGMEHWYSGHLSNPNYKFKMF